MKIKTRGNQAFSVPNTEEGRLFLRQARKFINPRWAYRRRGRGPRNAASPDSISASHPDCEWVALYLFGPPAPPGRALKQAVRAAKRRLFGKDYERIANSITSELGKPGPIGYALLDPVAHLSWLQRDDTVSSVPYDAEPCAPVTTDRAGHIPPPASNPCAEVPLPYEVSEGAGEFPILAGATGPFTVRVKEWSAPIQAGDSVAIGQDGRAYNPATHGMESLNDRLGVALSVGEGSIGDGHALVNVDLNTAPALALPSPTNQALAHLQPITLDDPEINFIDLRPGMDKVPQEEDVTELTLEEQEMLERVLHEYGKWSTGHWSNEDQEVFDKLFNKLVD